MSKPQFNSFGDFYPYYLDQHLNPTCRLLHVLGVIASAVAVVLFVVMKHYLYAMCSPLIGYAFGWTGHFVFEKNMPATFKWPVYSFIGDLKMAVNVLTGEIRLRDTARYQK